MAGFTESMLIHKLQELNSSQQSIQTLSLWLVHHRKHFAVVVKTWYEEILKANYGKQLTFMYLANDVIQNSKNEGPEYGKEFGEVLVESFKHMVKTGINTKTKYSLHRILSIWEEIGVYDPQKIQEFKEAVDSNDAFPKKVSKRKSEDVDANKDSDKKAPAKRCCRCGGPIKVDRHLQGCGGPMKVDRHLQAHTMLSPEMPLGDTPESVVPNEHKELIRALLELDASASTDEAIRERIASAPPDVAEKALFLSKMPPYHRINFIIYLVKRLIYQNNLRNIWNLFKPKTNGDM